jgi:SAM-dependent methyltransferase
VSDDFYAAFEEKFRGSRSLIKSRLRAYLPFVEPLSEFYGGQSVEDLGCGRGEWLELMEASGFKPHGVDLDAEMLRSCRELGLSVEQGDAIAFITSLRSESQVVVSAFHFVEHISFSDLRTVVAEAFRVLVPGGLLIMETPNPENMMVATQNFYLDPTHERPIPSQLLAFIPEYYGFSRIKIVRLQESETLPGGVALGIHDVLAGVSPDYGVIAQKLADEDIWSKTGGAFEIDFGVDLGTLAQRYDGQIMVKAEQAEVKAEQAEVKAEQAEVKAEQAEVKAEQAEVKAEQAENAVNLIYSSRSWRYTAPLRRVILQVRLLRENGLASRISTLGNKAMKFLSHRSENFIRARPEAAQRLVRIAHGVGIHKPLKVIYTASKRNSNLNAIASSHLGKTKDISFEIFGREVMSQSEWRTKADKVTESLPYVAPLVSLRRELSLKDYKQVAEKNSSATPRASIIASLYRSSDFLDSYLGNLLEQTIFEECEFCLVLVDPSSEELHLATSFAQNFSNVKLKVIPELIGIYKAWNFAIEMSRSPYLTNANADDLRRRDSLELQVNLLDRFNWVDVVYQDFYYSYDSTLAWEYVAAVNARCELSHVSPASLLSGVNAPHNAPMWRKSLHGELGMFDETLQSASDYDFWLRCAQAGKQFFKIRDPHVAYFLNPNGLSTQADGPGSTEPRIVQERYSHLLSTVSLPRYALSDEKGANSFELAERVTIGALESLRRMRAQSNG